MIMRKKVSATGAITLPKILRQMQGISKNTVLELVPEDSGDIRIKKITPTCYICGSTSEQVKLEDKTICKECVRKAIEILGEENE